MGYEENIPWACRAQGLSTDAFMASGLRGVTGAGRMDVNTMMRRDDTGPLRAGGLACARGSGWLQSRKGKAHGHPDRQMYQNMSVLYNLMHVP